MNATETRRIVAMLCEAYRQRPTEATYLAFHEMIHDLEPRHVEQARLEVQKQSSKWMPNPGELREAAKQVRSRGLSLAVQAWQYLLWGQTREPLAAKVASDLGIAKHDPELHTEEMRRKFLAGYTAVLAQHGDSLPLAIEHVQQKQIEATK